MTRTLIVHDTVGAVPGLVPDADRLTSMTRARWPAAKLGLVTLAGMRRRHPS